MTATRAERVLLGIDLSPLSPLEKIKIENRIKKYGFERAELDVEILLAYAIEAERTAEDIGPFDPAYAHFAQQYLDFFEMAGYVEKLGLKVT